MRPPAWLPNAVSCLRFLLLPAWILAVYGIEPFGPAPDPWAGASILLVLGATDVVDGWIARRFGLTSEMGAVLDAAADKLAQFLVFSCLAFAPPPGFYAVPVAFVAMLFLRDLTMIIGIAWIHRRRHRYQVVHETHGKVQTVALFAFMLALHAPASPVHTALLLGVTAAVLLSTALYVRRGVAVLRGIDLA